MNHAKEKLIELPFTYFLKVRMWKTKNWTEEALVGEGVARDKILRKKQVKM